MATWLKVWLIAVLAFNSAAAIVDGRRCSAQDEAGCAAACGSCAPCIAAEPCGDTDAGCAECSAETGCPTWACLLCRCDDRIPPTRQQIPSEPKQAAPAKPTYADAGAWREARAASRPVHLRWAATTPPERLALICVWRL